MLSAIGCSGKIEGSFPVVLPGFSEAELAYSDGFDSAEQGLYKVDPKVDPISWTGLGRY